jgi:hypothetical protein
VAEKWRVELNQYQDDFIFSTCRFPALFSAWGTGKTLAMIIKGLRLSEESPHNLGAIFRKEYTDLRASTMKDWYDYTGIPINEQKKEAKVGNSTVMFLHAKELDILNNINLGWAGVEQTDEIDNPDVFDKLDGRCRRNGVKQHCVMAIGNTTDENHWQYRYWKDNPDKDTRFQYWEADSFANAHNLPKETIESWRLLEKRNPALFKRFVLNLWGIGNDQFVVISPDLIARFRESWSPNIPDTKIISIDPSLGGDECTIKYFRKREVRDKFSLFERDTMKIAGYAVQMGTKWDCDNYIVDVIGVGVGVADNLRQQGKEVQYFNSSEKSTDPRYENRRAEGWFYMQSEWQEGRVPYPEDTETRRQLTSVRFLPPSGSKGTMRIEEKALIKKRISRSPDDADNFQMGIWGSQFVKPKARSEGEYRYKHKQDTGGYMSV